VLFDLITTYRHRASVIGVGEVSKKVIDHNTNEVIGLS